MARDLIEKITIDDKTRSLSYNIEDLSSEIEESLNKATTTLINKIISGAINMHASDIHFEIMEEKALLRIRVDGVLHTVIELPRKIYEKILSRIKLMSRLKLNIEDVPQDGRFSVVIANEKNKIEIRTSTLPSEKGESIVMRILNPKNLKDITELGIREDLMEVFEKAIKSPTGMIITTGPTGSGKTTTLYAFLKRIKSPEIKIITIEDPIEYHLEGLTQTQVSSHYSFADGLKSIMRQDPDIILVGEIRDKDTAKIAVQAALTGHKVFSTIHANEAVGIISRMISLGVESVNLGPALRMCIAQRLLRKICQKCAIEEKMPEDVFNRMLEEIKKMPKYVKVPDLSKESTVLKAKGCKECNFTGYKGRVGIFEAFLVDDRIEEMIIKKASDLDIKKILLSKGMTTLKQDAIIKILEHKTTIKEAERVVGAI